LLEAQALKGTMAHQGHKELLAHKASLAKLDHPESLALATTAHSHVPHQATEQQEQGNRTGKLEEWHWINISVWANGLLLQILLTTNNGAPRSLLKANL